MAYTGAVGFLPHCPTIAMLIPSTANGFTQYWDSTANAPYSFNAQRRLMASYDNIRSITLKTEYVIKHKLNGIMFWQLGEDTLKEGLLDAIDKTRKQE